MQVLLQTSASGDREGVEAKLAKFEDSDDEEERYHDIKEEEDDDDAKEASDNGDSSDDDDPEIEIKMEEDDDKPKASGSSSSWVHKHNFSARGTKVGNKIGANSGNPGPKKYAHGAYDPLARNPMYSGAERTLMWELVQLSQHYHPSVCLFANNLLDGIPIKYTGKINSKWKKRTRKKCVRHFFFKAIHYRISL